MIPLLFTVGSGSTPAADLHGCAFITDQPRFSASLLNAARFGCSVLDARRGRATVGDEGCEDTEASLTWNGGSTWNGGGSWS